MIGTGQPSPESVFPADSGASSRPAMRKASVDRTIVHLKSDGSRRTKRDRVAGEEPLEIRVAGPGSEASTIAITMRTPGHDFALAVGFLLTEGILHGQEDLRTVEYCTKGVGVEQMYNIVTVRTARPIVDGVSRRALVTSASCGICGTSTLDDLEATIPTAPVGDPLQVAADVLLSLPDRLRAEQPLFDRTGGLHGVGLFEASGRPLFVREDIGRHNAVDKVIGEAVLAKDASLAAAILVVSGRVSFEIVQKAAMAGITTIVAVSAASSLAIDAAERLGITLVGFVRNGGANLYTHAHRVI